MGEIRACGGNIRNKFSARFGSVFAKFALCVAIFVIIQSRPWRVIGTTREVRRYVAACGLFSHQLIREELILQF